MVDFECNLNNVTLRRITLRELEPSLDNVLVVGLIIGKQRPRKFPDKRQDGTFKAVWNFTLRDSARDYINVTYWGKSEVVGAANDKFYTGDVVELVRPRITIGQFDDRGAQYRPMATSPYLLELNENSRILSHSGDTARFVRLLNLPTKSIARYVPLRDVHNEGGNMKDRFVDILGAVKTVGPVRSVTSKNGQVSQLREMVVFDHTSPGMKVVIWDTDIMTRATSWNPRSTILFLTDMKVDWSKFQNCYTLTLTSRSIVTENPTGEEAATLANYAKTAPLATSDILDHMITAIPDPDTIQNVMCVQQVHAKINSIIQNGTGGDQPLTALMFVVVTQLDLDGLAPNISIKCKGCKALLQKMSEACENPVCFGRTTDVDVSFYIRINLSDHTGTLSNCRMSGSSAEAILNCSVEQFLQMTDEQKCQLKWRFLMERCAVRIMVTFINRRSPTISVISCGRANPIETAQRIPIF